MVGQYIQGREVAAAAGDDDIGKVFGWLDKLEIHGTDSVFILLKNAVDASSAFVNISFQAPHQADVQSNINENLKVH